MNTTDAQLSQILSQFPQYYADSVNQFQMILHESIIAFWIIFGVAVVLATIWVFRFLQYRSLSIYADCLDSWLIPCLIVICIIAEIPLSIYIHNALANPHWQVIQQMLPQHN